VPYLLIGDKYVAQSSVTEGGDLKVNPFSTVSTINKVGGGTLFGGFDAALSGSDGVASHMTAEWLDYEIRVPGEEPEHLRRPVFDLLGPAQRAAKVQDFDATTNDRMVARYEALLSTTDILLQPCDFTNEFVTHLALDRVVASRPAFEALMRESDRTKARQQAGGLLEFLTAGGPLPYLALWRADLADRPGGRFIDRPNVLNYRISQPVVQAGVEFRELIDIVSNGIGVREYGGTKAFESRLNQGVADTVAEALTLSGNLHGAENVAAVFLIAREQPDHGPLIVVRGRDAVTRLGWPEDAAARLAQDVAGNYVAIVPGKPVPIGGRERVGWWRVNVSSGETIGVMDSGFHGSAAAEKEELDTGLGSLAQKLRDYANNPSNAKWAKTARDFLTRPGVTSLGRAEMNRLAMHTKLIRLLRTLTLMGY
jgi:hypothetical protein